MLLFTKDCLAIGHSAIGSKWENPGKEAGAKYVLEVVGSWVGDSWGAFHSTQIGQLHDDVIWLQLPESLSLLFSCAN